MADLLTCTIMPYAWGSRTAIAELEGRLTPSPGPEAELWVGAHPGAPSFVMRKGVQQPLDAIIAADPARELGKQTVARFGPRLPFLLKVLAASQPLSLQAHPTEDQAAAGFADEERRGVPRDAAQRNYKDPHHKPELICALTPFEAICGFRRIADTLALTADLAVPELDALLAPLRTSPDRTGLVAAFTAIMTMEPVARERTVEAVTTACRGYQGRFRHECAWTVRLAERYPGDAGVIGALMLNFMRLDPGQGVFLGAGHLHAYLEGVGIELMAASDNVLRGGLTPKHVDAPELLRVLNFVDGPVPLVQPRPTNEEEVVWDTPAPEFRLSRVHVRMRRQMSRRIDAPEILLCTEGTLELQPWDGSSAVTLQRGQAVFVPGSSEGYSLAGSGVAFRATPGSID